MSLIRDLDTKLSLTSSSTTDPTDDLAAFVVRFKFDALRRALLVIEPESLPDALIHARHLRDAVLAIPVNDPALQCRLNILANALNFRGALEAESGSQCAGLIAKASADLARVDLSFPTANPKSRLACQGAALERTILTTPARSLREACAQADVVCRWARDLSFHDWANEAPRGFVDAAELVEQGADSLSRGLHSIAGLPAPADAAAFEFLASA